MSDDVHRESRDRQRAAMGPTGTFTKATLDEAWEKLKGKPTVTDPLSDEMKAQGVTMTKPFVPDGPDLETWARLADMSLNEIIHRMATLEKNFRERGQTLRKVDEAKRKYERLANGAKEELQKVKTNRELMKTQRNEARLRVKELEAALEAELATVPDPASFVIDASVQPSEPWLWRVATAILFLTVLALLYVMFSTSFHEVQDTLRQEF